MPDPLGLGGLSLTGYTRGDLTCPLTRRAENREDEAGHRRRSLRPFAGQRDARHVGDEEDVRLTAHNPAMTGRGHAYILMTGVSAITASRLEQRRPPVAQSSTRSVGAIAVASILCLAAGGATATGVMLQRPILIPAFTMASILLVFAAVTVFRRSIRARSSVGHPHSCGIR